MILYHIFINKRRPAYQVKKITLTGDRPLGRQSHKGVFVKKIDIVYYVNNREGYKVLFEK